jgi:hypothetical protein
MVHETRLVRLSTSKAHRSIAFLAIGLFGKRSWRGGGPFHQRPYLALADALKAFSIARTALKMAFPLE